MLRQCQNTLESSVARLKAMRCVIEPFVRKVRHFWVHTPSFAKYVHFLDRGDLKGGGELMLRSAQMLANAGADFLICSDNTIHEAFSYVEPRSPLPWLHIAEVVAAEGLATLDSTRLLARAALQHAVESSGEHWRHSGHSFDSHAI